MHEVYAVIGIVFSLAIGAASPGPSFVMVAKTAAMSRSNGISSAIGMGIGGLIFATFSLLGLHSIFIAASSLYTFLKFAGSIYLVYLGFKIWRDAQKPIFENTPTNQKMNRSILSNFFLGVSTQLSNPKTVIVYSSVFTAFMPSETSLFFDICIVILVFAIESGWYSIVTLALSTKKSRVVYLHFKKLIDRISGSVMIALGIKLALSSTH